MQRPSTMIPSVVTLIIVYFLQPFKAVPVMQAKTGALKTPTVFATFDLPDKTKSSLTGQHDLGPMDVNRYPLVVPASSSSVVPQTGNFEMQTIPNEEELWPQSISSRTGGMSDSVEVTDYDRDQLRNPWEDDNTFSAHLDDVEPILPSSIFME
ncbi:unnamed protein product [Echinostoma caproni]|uniref:Secreted protein n=1 Tax=Echinostoma caproni TaxID=27848 RepID=A0A183ALE5_9TREM|nr:unnamed protein product [Echinostoma caproni]